MNLIKMKRLNENAVLPKKAHKTDAAVDLVVSSVNFKGNKVTYGAGIALEIPAGYVGKIYPRSSVVKTGLRLANSVGIIDSGYRGEIMAVFDVINETGPFYEIGDRMCQLIIEKNEDFGFIEVDELNESDRGLGGFGSSGK